jgi:hypothetical protein
MKKLLTVLCLFLMSFVVVSCASTVPVSEPAPVSEQPAPVSQPAPAPTPTPTPASAPVTTFEPVYNTYQNDLILDGATKYVVKKGDFLAAITHTAYGNSNGYFFPVIMLASSDVVLDPDLIYPEASLTIPDLERNLNDPTSRQRIKSFLLDIAGVYDRKEQPIISRDLRQLANSL